MSMRVKERSKGEIRKKLLDVAIYSPTVRWQGEHRDLVGSLSRDVAHIARCVKDIIETSHQLFRIGESNIHLVTESKRLEIRSKPAGESLLKFMKMGWDHIFGELMLVRHNPYVDLFFEILYDQNLNVKLSGGYTAQQVCQSVAWWPKLIDEERRAVLDGLNDLVQRIRQRGTGMEFRASVERYMRPAIEAYRSIIKLVRTLHQRFHRLLILRLDLTYLLAARQSLSYADVRAHGNSFSRYVRERCPVLRSACLGVVLKLEFGLDIGLHYHAMVVLNGSKLRGDKRLAQMLGQKWSKEITEGKGSYFNCNVRPYGASRGIGSVGYEDVATRANLEERVVAYLAKPDFYIREIKPDADHTLWLSQPNKCQDGRRGRKRGKSDALA